METNIWYGGEEAENGLAAPASTTETIETTEETENPPSTINDQLNGSDLPGNVVIKQEPRDDLSSYTSVNLALNCYYCSYKTTDPVEYAEHIRSHTAKAAHPEPVVNDGEDELEGDYDTLGNLLLSSSDESSSGENATPDASPVPKAKLNDAAVVMVDIMKIPCDELANVME